MRVLHSIYGLNIGGVETFIYNLVSELPEINFEFVIQDERIQHIGLKTLCEKRGYPIHVIPAFNRNYIAHIRAMRELLASGYDVVHFHQNALINGLPILMAGNYSSRVVLHSHSSNINKGGKVANLIHHFFKLVIGNRNIIRLACSDLAAQWMFGNTDYLFFPNAVNLDTFAYNPKLRTQKRNELKLTDEFVIGHVGRFVEAKNHVKLLSIFKELHFRRPNSKLIMIGGGNLKDLVRTKVKEMGLSKDVVLLDPTSDVALYYQAFDCFVFPSLFEGLPFTVVEAQAAGLPVILSDTITRRVDAVGILKFLSPNAPDAEWVEMILNYVIQDRSAEGAKMRGGSFDADNMASIMVDIYTHKQ